MNSTANLSGSHPGVEALQIYGLPYLQSALTRYRPEAGILYCAALYSPFLARTFAFSSPKHSRARHCPYLPLLAHILAALLLVVRYHARYVVLHAWPAPDTTNLALFSTSSLTSVYVLAYRSRSLQGTLRAASRLPC